MADDSAEREINTICDFTIIYLNTAAAVNTGAIVHYCAEDFRLRYKRVVKKYVLFALIYAYFVCMNIIHKCGIKVNMSITNCRTSHM